MDAHVHFWSVRDHDWYAALEPYAEQVGSTTLYSDFLPDAYRETASGVTVQSFVHVSATTTTRTFRDEAVWVNSLADHHGLSLGIIGSIDPTSPADEIIADLDFQAEATSRRFRGARVFPGLDPDEPSTTVLLDWLESHDLVFDLVIMPGTTRAWIDKLAAYPDLRTVIEHTGSPTGTDSESVEHWRSGMHELAQRTDALCKVSGLGMTTMDLSAPALRPWIDGAIDAFGWDRVAFGSNMPIETIAGSYRQLVDSLESIIGGCSASERERFYASNARHFYRL